MALLGEVLFPPAPYRRTTASLLVWWESRRVTFNVAVGTAGVLTLAAVRVLSWLAPAMAVPFDWRPVAAYALGANMCYTFGWAIEALAQRIWRTKCPAFGPALFRQGLAFSVGLTLLPILIMSIGGAAHWLFRLFF